MPDTENARLMLDLAAEELRALRAMDDPLVFSPRLFGFHAQQVAEKVLKAWLSLLDTDTQPRCVVRLAG